MATSRNAHAAAMEAAKLEGAEAVEAELDTVKAQVAVAQEDSKKHLQELQRQQVRSWPASLWSAITISRIAHPSDRLTLCALVQDSITQLQDQASKLQADRQQLETSLQAAEADSKRVQDELRETRQHLEAERTAHQSAKAKIARHQETMQVQAATPFVAACCLVMTHAPTSCICSGGG